MLPFVNNQQRGKNHGEKGRRALRRQAHVPNPFNFWEKKTGDPLAIFRSFKSIARTGERAAGEKEEGGAARRHLYAE